ncbi:unnamed protein product, partial [Moritella viscosa]
MFFLSFLFILYYYENYYFLNRFVGMRNISIISFLLLTSLGCTAASYDYEDPNLVITDS